MQKIVLHAVLVMVVVGVLVWLFWPAKEKDADVKPQNDSFMVSDSINAELKANLERLKQEQQQMQANLQVAHTISLADREDNKIYKFRQTQPTSLYSGAPPVAKPVSMPNSDNTIQTTFAGHSANEQFGNQAMTASTVEATRIAHPGFTIASGEFLHAALETAINSDLPGHVRAVVTRPVFAYQGERPLIPAGSRLIGQYSSGIIQGQSRVMVMWERVILPNGIAAQIGSPGTDALGRAGQGANSINRHFFARFGQAALLSVIGAGVSTTGVGGMDEYNSAAQYRMAVAESFQQSANDALKTDGNIKPTLRIDQGAQINVFVAHDVSFYNALAGHSAGRWK